MVYQVSAAYFCASQSAIRSAYFVEQRRFSHANQPPELGRNFKPVA